jgi:DNA invertase Pin-like site-specific DNA recombinase
MLVGYMRVSTTDDRQTVDLQRDALVATGVDHRHLHTDKASGARDDRPGLKACLDYLNGSVANIGDGRAASPRLGIRQHWQNAD